MRVLRLACLSGSLFALAACGSSSGTSSTTTPAPAAAPGGRPAAATPENIAAGKELFEKNSCIQCHGQGGGGTQNAPALNDKNWLHGRGQFSQIMATIINGVPLSDVVGGYSRGMPERGGSLRGAPVRLNDADITKIAAYVWSISEGAGM